jgi:hypothetical protein
MKEIFESNGKWYFWNETWSDSYGPYDTLEQVQMAFSDYCETVLKPSPEESEDDINRGYN